LGDGPAKPVPDPQSCRRSRPEQYVKKQFLNMIVAKNVLPAAGAASFPVAATQRIDTCRKLRFLDAQRKNVAEAIQESPT
jgi:hypothetical protein